MTRLIAIALAATLAAPVAAPPARAADDPEILAQALVPGTITEAGTLALESFLWQARPVVVFADTPADPRFQQQLDMITAEIDRLAERDVVILTDVDPAAAGPIRAKLRPRGFQVVLIGKDGVVDLRKPFPYSVREITRIIDKTPLRQQEVRDRRAQPGTGAAD
ncbi:DUF4174 domain-containing protein [Marinibacterium sp. SX1]|uniref:DUF4174 domain-containing protein n=1 Tax=Marinibacterium sp. SX1 TaxID=3388424 RepID=UPI003D16A5DC